MPVDTAVPGALRLQPEAGAVAHADTIAAIATAPGEGAIGVLRLSGPDSLRVAAGFIEWSQPPAPRTAMLARARAGGEPVDEVLLTFFPGPRSYTGEDMVELSAHGSPYILARLLDEARNCGARLAEPGEYTQRAFLNGRMDLTQAEAVCQLIRARTSRAHRIALQQLQGGLARRLEAIRGGIVDLLAATEAQLDHPEEDIPCLSPDEAAARLRRLDADIAALLETYRVGRLAAEGARIAIVGLANVGKSSLLNRLLGRERAIVAATPGTTRDTLEEAVELDGLQAVFIDTAGLREKASDPVEQEGMERTRRALAASDLALVVLDRSQPLGPKERGILSDMTAHGDISLPWPHSPAHQSKPMIVVLNKSDLPAKTAPQDVFHCSPHSADDCIEISALHGSGIPALLRAISRALLRDAMTGPDLGAAVTSLRHRHALEDARAALERAGKRPEEELSALHLREALSSIGAILGETTTEDILKSIFSSFCIGK